MDWLTSDSQAVYERVQALEHSLTLKDGDQMRLSDFQIERLTFEGDYNAKASLLPDGSGIVFVHRRDGQIEP